MKNALRYAVEHSFDALVLLDGDGQHDPNEIPKLLVPLIKDTADIVIGFRSFDQMPAYRRVGRKVLDRATGGPVRDSQCGFRALNRHALRQYKERQDKYYGQKGTHRKGRNAEFGIQRIFKIKG